MKSWHCHLLSDPVKRPRGMTEAATGLHGGVLFRDAVELLEVAAQAVVEALIVFHMLHTVCLSVRQSTSLQYAIMPLMSA